MIRQYCFPSVRGEFFFLVGGKVKATLKTPFKPDKMNYAALSNVSEKVHVHFVPRYKTSVLHSYVFFQER